MRPAFFDNPDYKQKQAEIARNNWQKGVYKPLVKKEDRNCKYPQCKNTFIVSPSDKQKFCSKECWYLEKTKWKNSQLLKCFSCGNQINAKNAHKFCSLKCQAIFGYQEYIQKWKAGLIDGTIGVKTRVLSRHIKHYLLKKYKSKCLQCGWNQIHPVTGHVPLEIDHIDGNHSNNIEENLRLICPNCHALTPNFRNLNKGKGRAWRLKRSPMI